MRFKNKRKLKLSLGFWGENKVLGGVGH